jgi:hypothetical protein
VEDLAADMGVQAWGIQLRLNQFTASRNSPYAVRGCWHFCGGQRLRIWPPAVIVFDDDALRQEVNPAELRFMAYVGAAIHRERGRFL